MEKIKGYIGKFVFQSDDGGYTVMEVIANGKAITCVGTVRGYSVGETVEVEGEYVVHPIYKKQIKISGIRAVAPEDSVAIERYLGSGAIRGIGESLAARIVKCFGDDTLRIMEEEPERLAEVKGISARKAQDIANQLVEKRDLREAMIFLQQYGISQTLANKIYVKYGNEIYRIMKENPYRLAEDITGVGFKTADEIAKKSGILVDSDYRIRCGILHAMLETTSEGHCYYPKELLLNKASEILELPIEALESQMYNLAMDKKIVIKKAGEGERVYAASYYYEEAKCAAKLLELKTSYEDWQPIEPVKEIERKIDRIQQSMDMELEDLQRQAVLQCVQSGVFVLSGGPGTGKTTTINAIIRYFDREGLDVYLAAPTGRAAKRMTETTGYEARTIHRLLEISGELSEERKNAFFERNEENPLEADVVIIDEVSMVDIHLLKALLAALVPGTKLVLVGDMDQLPSVGPGQVLKDILASECFPFVKLQKIFRQAKESHIVSYAHKINRGETIDFSEKYCDFFLLDKDNAEVIYSYIEQLMKAKIPKQFGVQMYETQVLTPMRKGSLGVEMLNQVLQERLNPASPEKAEHEYGDVIFREGDKVMQIKNNYNLEWEVIGNYNIPIDSGQGVFNGDVGVVEEVNEFSKTLTVLFDDGRTVMYPFSALDELEHAFAVTIHKSQGSEYPAVIIPVLTGPKMLLNRNLFYTGVTRAKNCVVLLGNTMAFQEMIASKSQQKRYTSLDERLREIGKGR
ncbi:MAG: ATP-dependent RecD-like DNA helicase [Lachnospiraceae bacterium]|nr:ATP-dependent RecD-like DNA helicase [Lachnospiraceae bacterium]